MARRLRIGYPRDVRIAADLGSYATSGQTATLNRGFTLVASLGAYQATGQTATLTVTNPSATSFTLSGSTSGITGQPTTFTVTPNASTSGAVVVTITAPGATLSTSSLTFNNSSTPQTFTVTRSTDGTTSVSIASPLIEIGSPISYTTTTTGAISEIEKWLYKSTLPGVFRKIRFDTDAAVNNFRFTDQVGWDPSPSPGSLGSFVRRNATEGRIGDGALELEQLTNGNMAAYLWLPFDQTRANYQFNETGFNRGPGEEFYVHVWHKTNCSGTGSNGGAGRKVFSVTRGTQSYTANELVVQDTEYRGIQQMYQGLGPGGVAYSPFLEARGESDFDLQPGADYVAEPSYCSYQAGNYMNQAACATWFNNEYVQYRLHVIPSTNGVSNGTLELEFWKSGMATSKKSLSRTNIPMFYDGDKPAGYNHFIAWIYETGRTSGPANQKHWYDQIIISRTAIPFDYELPSIPTWYTNANTSEWLALTGGPAPTLASIDPCPSGTCSYSGVEKQISMVDDWCGGAASQNSLIIAAQGGHQNYGGNEVYEYVFNTAAPQWFMRVAPSTNVPSDQTPNTDYYSDGKPASRHGYKHDCFIGPGTNGNRWFAPLAFAVYGNGNGGGGRAASYQQGASAYDPMGTFANDYTGLIDFDDCVAYDPVMHRVWVQEGGITARWRLHSLDVTTEAWTTYADSTTPMQSSVLNTGFIDPVRRLFVIQAGSTLFIRDLNNPNSTGRSYTVSGMAGVAIAYEPVSGKWVNWNGGRTLRVITPPSNYRTGDGSTLNPLNASATYTSTTVTPSAGATPSAATPLGTYGRFAYIASPRGFCVYNDVSEPMYFFKIPTTGL